MASGSNGSRSIQAWAFDLDGVIWTGGTPIAGSAEAVQHLIEAGHKVAFVTNNSYSTVSHQEEKLGSFGISAEGRVVTSAMAGAALVDSGQRVYVLGGPGVVEAVEARGASVVDDQEARRQVPDAVLVGLDRELSYQRLSTAVLSVRAGSRFVATNTDSTFPSEIGLLPGGGAIVRAVAYSTDREPTIAGKPHRAQARLVRELLGPEGIMVGDRPETDGLFARTLGYAFGLVLTGVTPAGDLPVEPHPEHVADDLAALVTDLTT
jgi:4-nitrophenyl phosphatase